MQTPATPNSRHGWQAVLAIAAGTFVMVTSEFLPIGLLGPMARDLHVSTGQAGLMVTMPGMVAALAAPLLTLTVGRLDRRLLLLALSALIVLADLVVAFAQGLVPVLLGRVLLGLALGGFWAFSAAAGRRLVNDVDGHRAVALILGGISVGTVAGVPLGTMLGDLAGWRMAFGAAAALGTLVLLAQVRLLPVLRGEGSVSPRDLFGLLTLPAARAGYAASALIAGAHFAAYTYVEPLMGAAGWSGSGLTALLATFGLAGIAGTWAGERIASVRVLGAFITVALGVATAMALVLMGTKGLPVMQRDEIIVAGMLLWGAAFGALPVCVQIWIHQAAPDRFEGGSALMVTVFQIAVAGGAFGGGRLVDSIDIGAAFGAGIALALGGALVLALFGLTYRRGPQTLLQP